MTNQSPAASKTCIGCKQTKELDQFGKHAQTPDGLRTRCRVCCKRGAAATGRNNKVCNMCRQEKGLNLFADNKKNRNGKGAQCQECRTELERLQPCHQPAAAKVYRARIPPARRKTQMTAWRDQNKAHVMSYDKAYNKTLAGCVKQYKSNARRADRVFELTLEDFEALWQKTCTYCGSDIATIGLDRVDSSKGYTLDNVVACCTACNKSKLNLDLNEWLAHIRRIVEHQDQSQDPRKA